MGAGARQRARFAFVAALGAAFIFVAVASIEYEERLAPGLARLGQSLSETMQLAARRADPMFASAGALLMSFIAHPRG